ncbi:DNA/RNA polymerase [Gigaspora margarita]|uniref:DNA-directed DNA polymerase n=1 Tax=Gigaspora margarita TaxID=4874 RepID=A0A8H3X994_GIGMA|nr:DNA/RNA polymerase [Gigaspora margarita]
MKCKYFYKQGTVFLDLLTWARKIFQTEVKHTLDYILKEYGLEGKADLLYLLSDSDNLHSMFVYITLIKHYNDLEILSKMVLKLLSKCNIDYQICLNSMNVNKEMLENYAIDIAYYCFIDTLKLQKLLIKRNIISDYIQLAAILCVTISNVFLNGVGTLVLNTYGRYTAKCYKLLSTILKRIVETGNKYEGALVLEVEDKEINELVADLDINSFYPNAIIQNNIDLSTLVNNEYDDSSLIIVSNKEKIYRKFLPHYNDKEKMGLMPLMCKKLLSEKSVAKINIKKYKNNNILLSYWTAKSNALKTLANATYGYSGSRFSPLFKKSIASS